VLLEMGKKSSMILKVLEGRSVGTYFEPSTKRLSSKKGWIAFGVRSRGAIVLDDGAVRALTTMGRSLLPSGITKVEGTFDIGDFVRCIDREGKKVAKGLTNYASEDLDKIKGKKTSEIERILGYKYSDEVIHRDNMVIV